MRYLPLEPADRAAMLQAVGVDNIDDLFADVPVDKLLKQTLELPAAKSELEVARELSNLAERNVPAASSPFFVGCGAYRHHVPATVDHLIQRSEFLTYQPEIAQGTLQTLFEFQTQVALLTGMEIANASMYDGSTSAAEAVLMAHRITRRGKAVLSGGLHPQYRQVIETLSHHSGSQCTALTPAPGGAEDAAAAIDAETSCVVVQYPDFYGHIRDLQPIADAAHAQGALLIATQQKHVRQMPGRICGETTDVEGRRGFVLTLSTREQHIRREKATSNICTNSGLCALAFTIHLSLLGETGLRNLAELNHANAVALADQLDAIAGVEVLNSAFFNEFTIRLTGRDAAATIDELAARGILGGVPASRLEPHNPELADLVIVAATEINTPQDRTAYASALKEILA